MLSQSLRADPRLQASRAPRLQQAVRLLQLPSLDFAQQLREVLRRNPFIVDADGDAAESSSGAQDASGASGQASLDADEPDAAADAAPRSFGGGAPAPRAAGRGEDARSIWETLACPLTLGDCLRGQLAAMPLGARDRVLAGVIVESLDDDGYLRSELADLVDAAALDPPASPDELRIALRWVQSLEPAGVAARDLGECLLAQVGSIPDAARRECARAILRDHLDRLAARDLPALVRALGRRADVVEAACRAIRRLDPRPGLRFQPLQAIYVVPDVLVRRVRGRWEAELNPAALPRLRLHRGYAELLRRDPAACAGELGWHLQEAGWWLHQVEKRSATILAVARAILSHQHRVLDAGPLAMRPLGLQQLADELGLHASTVSRATCGKYMQTPLGVFELKAWLSRALPMAGGTPCASVAIRELIKGWVETEAPGQRLSDAEIARRLATQGVRVARRTVTKYRQSLRLPALGLRGRM